MKLSKISLGVAAACGFLSAPAFAITASAYNNASEFSGTTENIRISGATAQDAGIVAATLRYCQAGTMTRYTITNNFVYFCNIDTTKLTPRAGATQLAVYKYSVGGSGAGVANVNAGLTNVPFLDLTKLATSCAGTSSTADLDGTEATSLPTFQDIACSGAASALTSNAVSYIGLSDVEPAFFGASSTYDKLKSEPLATVIFGIPVTKVAYTALQLAQGITSPDDSLAKMPSLSQGQITSMFTQAPQSWAGLTGAVLADDAIYVARRVDTSGTQKTFEALVARTVNGTPTGKSCQGSVDSFLSGPAAADNTAANSLCGGANQTVNGSGGGQVLACLNKHNSGGRGAVGVLTTESKAAAADQWRFVKINGIAPNQAGVASGQYTQYADASLNTRIVAPKTEDQPGYLAFLTALRADFSNPATIDVINGTTNQLFGEAGLMALDVLNPALVDSDRTGALHRNPWSRISSGDLNNCQPGKAALF